MELVIGHALGESDFHISSTQETANESAAGQNPHGSDFSMPNYRLLNGPGRNLSVPTGEIPHRKNWSHATQDVNRIS